MSLNATSTGGTVWSAAHLTSMVLSVKDILLFGSGRKWCNSVSRWNFHQLLVGPSWVSDSPMFTSQKNVKRDSTDAPEPYLLDRASSKTESN